MSFIPDKTLLVRADLHGSIFVACDKRTTGLRHDLRLSQHFKTCFRDVRAKFDFCLKILPLKDNELVVPEM